MVAKTAGWTPLMGKKMKNLVGAYVIFVLMEEGPSDFDLATV